VMPDGFDAGYEPRSRFLTPEEAPKLLAALTPDRAARVAFILAIGARWGESERARPEDVSLERGVVFLRGTKTVNAKRTLPVVGWGIPLLEHAVRYAEGEGGLLFRPWPNVRRDLAEACARAGIPRVSPNDLRRTYATWLREHGVEPHLIGLALGHRDSRMAERVYGRLSAESLGNSLRLHLDRCSKYVANAPESEAQVRPERTPEPTDFPPNMVSRDRIELSTRGFSVHCSTD
jgi:integrase